MGKPILCMDFDGVINSYESGWIEPVTKLPDPPVIDALEFLEEAQEYWDVHIYSSRSHHLDGIKAMQEWLMHHALLEGEVKGDDPDWTERWVNNIEWPTYKPPATLSIDDRGYRFEGRFPDPEELLRLKPWNKV